MSSPGKMQLIPMFPFEQSYFFIKEFCGVCRMFHMFSEGIEVCF